MKHHGRFKEKAYLKACALPPKKPYCQQVMIDTNQVAGAIIITFPVIAMYEVARSLRFLNIPFNIWMIAGPWILGADSNVVI